HFKTGVTPLHVPTSRSSRAETALRRGLVCGRRVQEAARSLEGGYPPLLIAVDDAAAREVVWRQLDLHAVTRVDPDAVAAHLARRVAERLGPVVERESARARAG